MFSVNDKNTYTAKYVCPFLNIMNERDDEIALVMIIFHQIYKLS